MRRATRDERRAMSDERTRNTSFPFHEPGSCHAPVGRQECLTTVRGRQMTSCGPAGSWQAHEPAGALVATRATCCLRIVTNEQAPWGSRRSPVTCAFARQARQVFAIRVEAEAPVAVV
jgi:hypothetical protein